jgi:ATP phosphoribosyltransferase
MQSTETVQASADSDRAPGTDIRLGLPKGRMQDNLLRLFQDAGIPVGLEPRGYRATVPLEGFQAKLLKPQNIVEMLHAGSRDAGFAGADWVAELGADLVELLDTGLDPVRVVAAAPAGLLVNGELPSDRSMVVASEYAGMTARWIGAKGIDARFVRSYGATEVFPPEDADCIVDNVATGSTLRANGLDIVDELMRSSTRLYANARVLDDPERRDRLEDLVLLLKSVVEARQRVMLEVNVPADRLDALVATLPCMREPTVSTLHGNTGFAVKAAVPRRELPALVLEIKAAGGTDIVVAGLSQIVP